MIETKEALDNLDDILKVEGIRMVYIGPSDLGNSLEESQLLTRKIRSL